MNKIVYCHYGGNNREVIDYYMSTIRIAIEKLGYTIKDVELKDSSRMDKNNYIIVTPKYAMFKWWLKGFRKFILWSQGVFPEESAMRHNNSQIRTIITAFIEKFTIKRADLLMVVSEKMIEHFESKYNIQIRDKCIVMPCYNCDIVRDSFYAKDKYKRNVFCYTGSLAEWQCFEKTADLYGRIEEKHPDASFMICTWEVEKAEYILKERGIKNYTVQYVRQEELPRVLAGCKFGFIIRDNVVVNNVATPTKLSTYIANGIIPIVSDCIDQYRLYFDGRDYLITVSDSLETDKIENCMSRDIKADSVFDVFSQFFDDYYNTDKYIKTISLNVSKLL